MADIDGMIGRTDAGLPEDCSLSCSREELLEDASNRRRVASIERVWK